MLDYPSKFVKDGRDHRAVDDILALLKVTKPQFVYTHNLADKHDTHVGVALKVIAAIRRLPKAERPEKLYGCEVWRNLDWVVDSDKVNFDVTKHENLQAALLGVFDSQICGGKRYELASMGRRKANATYAESHGVDETLRLSYGMDLTPLISDESFDPQAFIQVQIQKFADEVAARINKLS